MPGSEDNNATMGGWGFFDPIEETMPLPQDNMSGDGSLPIPRREGAFSLSSSLQMGRGSRSSTIVSCSPSGHAKKGFFENFFEEEDVQVLHEKLLVSLACAHDLCKAGFFSVELVLGADDLLLEEVLAAHCDESTVALTQERTRILSVSRQIVEQLQRNQQQPGHGVVSMGSRSSLDSSNPTTHEARSLPSPDSQLGREGQNQVVNGSERGQDQADEDASSMVSGVSGGSGYNEDAASDRDTDDEMLFTLDPLEQEDESSKKGGADLPMTQDFSVFMDYSSDQAPSF